MTLIPKIRLLIIIGVCILLSSGCYQRCLIDIYYTGSGYTYITECFDTKELETVTREGISGPNCIENNYYCYEEHTKDSCHDIADKHPYLNSNQKPAWVSENAYIVISWENGTCDGYYSSY